MGKAIKLTLTGAFIGLLLFVLIYGLIQLKKQKEEGKAKTLKDYLEGLNPEEVKNEAIKGAFLGGGVVLGILGMKALLLLFKKKDEDENPKPFHYDKFLRNKLKEIKLAFPESSEDELHFNVIRNLCATEFENEIITPPKLHGSRAKKVSHPTSSDFDLALIFNENYVIEELFWTTFERLKPILMKMGYSVRDQRFTTGVIIEREDKTTFSIDILAAKATPNYTITGDLWIWNSVDKTRQKTNIEGHNRQFISNPEARDTTLLIKQIKNKTGVKLLSPIINKIVPNAIRLKGGFSKFQNLKLAIGSLAQKFDNIYIRDPFNSNNNYLDKYTFREKQQTQNFLYGMLSDLNESPENLGKYL